MPRSGAPAGRGFPEDGLRNRHAQRIGACLLALAALPALAGKSRPLALRHQALDLPGPPAKVMAADVNGDSRPDLVVVVAYTEVEEIGESRIEDMVQVTTVIPALFDRRGVLEVPLLGYNRRPKTPVLMRVCRFAPRNSLTLPGFTVA